MKPGDLFNKFQAKKKKMYSEADMGSMKGYDPNLGVGKAGMKAMTKPMPIKVMGSVGKKMAKKKVSKKKKMTLDQDTAYDKKHGIKEHSSEDMKMDRKHGVKDKKKHSKKVMKMKAC